MKPYAIRRNPGTGGWIMYYLDRTGRRPVYRVIGWAATMPIAIDGLVE